MKPGPPRRIKGKEEGKSSGNHEKNITKEVIEGVNNTAVSTYHAVSPQPLYGAYNERKYILWSQYKSARKAFGQIHNETKSRIQKHQHHAMTNSGTEIPKSIRLPGT